MGPALLICVVLPAPPSDTSRTPPLAPVAQNRLPSSVAAPRTLPPLNVSLMTVDESTVPLASTRATTRFTAVEVVPLTLAVPGPVS
jgi:hypothetical protein